MAGTLAGKVAFISGAASGIGAACAQEFGEQGAKVVVADVDEPRGRAVADRLNADGGGGIAIFAPLDVTKAVQWRAAVTAGLSAFGKVDVLVACAGVLSMAGLLDEDEATWDRVLAINQTGVWLGMRAVVPEMQKAGGGSIVLLSSIWGRVGAAGAMTYQATKGAVVLLAKAAAAEFAGANIRANALMPGIVDTPFLNGLTPEQRTGITGTSLMKREGRPQEIARAARFLASDDASYVTGTEFYVDGGYTAC